MAARLKGLWQNLLSGLWFVPGCVAAAYVLLAIALTAIEARMGPQGANFGFTGSAGVAGTLLSTVAGSLITVTGLALSLTIVTVQLVSAQFTPRAIGNFLGDRAIQLITGALIGTFAYCLLVLRVLRAAGEGHPEFVPAFAISLAIVLSLAAIGLLVVFVHRVSQMIQVTAISRAIAKRTLASIDRIYPDPYRHPEPEPAPAVEPGPSGTGAIEVEAQKMGYARQIGLEAIAAAASQDARIEVLVPRGSFVTELTVIARVRGQPGDAEVVRQALVVAADRHLEHDAGFGLQQLSDIALRALSPGINDPSTALTCISYLQALLERLVAREMPRRMAGISGALVTARRDDFGGLVEPLLAGLGRYAAADAGVAAALLEAIAAISRRAEAAGAPSRAAALRTTAAEIRDAALERAATESDRASLREAGSRQGG
ncbi:MAG: DUF2254 domain-containing protein [Candidatus Dormibacteraeota bacterium]|nr:DUF2254 domain-containing protein [Candidatus Dormibacteraeota bacterium]